MSFVIFYSMWLSLCVGWVVCPINIVKGDGFNFGRDVESDGDEGQCVFSPSFCIFSGIIQLQCSCR